MTGATVSIDFGTSTTALAVRNGSGPRLIRFENETRTPSCVFWDKRAGRLIAGRRAWAQRQAAPELFIRTPKRKIDDPDVLLGDRLVGVPELFAAVIEHVLREGGAQLGGEEPDEVRLTHPAAWTPARLAILNAAGHQALTGLGWSDVPIQLLAEPVAAAVEVAAARAMEPGRALVVYDLGGGTFDVTVVRRTPIGFEVIGMPDGHDACGGEHFDERLLEDLDRRLSPSLPAWREVYHPSVADTSPRSKLRDNVIAAKEGLSKKQMWDVQVPPPARHLEQVTRDQLVALIRQDVADTVSILLEAIERAKRGGGVSERDLVGIVLTGGSSRIPLVEALVRGAAPELEIFPAADPKGVVALGGARWAPQPVVSPGPPGGGRAPRDPLPVDPYSTGEFRCRLGVKLGSGWRFGEARLDVGGGELVLRDYDCDLKSSDKWADATRKKLLDGTVMGRVTAARVAGVENGVQAWLLESGADGSAVKSLHRFALRRSIAGERGLLITGREEAAELINHVRIGESRLASREFEHTPFVVRVPPGKSVSERITVEPKRRLLGRADFGVFAESSLVSPTTTSDQWVRRVLARFADSDVSIETTQDTFLDGRAAKRHVVRTRAAASTTGFAWWCLWTGVLDGRGVTVGIESPKELRGDRAAQFRDIFVLADA